MVRMDRMDRMDQGMTLLEVTMALVILVIGVGFVIQSDALSYRYRAEHQQRQQMLFYGAGQLEALIQGTEVEGANAPFSNYETETVITEINPRLEEVKLTVTAPESTQPPEPVVLYTYRVKP